MVCFAKIAIDQSGIISLVKFGRVVTERKTTLSSYWICCQCLECWMEIYCNKFLSDEFGNIF